MFCFSLMHMQCSLLLVFWVPLLMKHVGQTTLLRYLCLDGYQEPGLLLRGLEYFNNAHIAQNLLFGTVKSIFSGLNCCKMSKMVILGLY